MSVNYSIIQNKQTILWTTNVSTIVARLKIIMNKFCSLSVFQSKQTPILLQQQHLGVTKNPEDKVPGGTLGLLESKSIQKTMTKLEILDYELVVKEQGFL